MREQNYTIVVSKAAPLSYLHIVLNCIYVFPSALSNFLYLPYCTYPKILPILDVINQLVYTLVSYSKMIFSLTFNKTVNITYSNYI